MSKKTPESPNKRRYTKNGNNSGKDRRTIAVKQKDKHLQANQWQGTPQQLEFMALWLDPNSSVFGNAYQAGKLAGYSDNYAKQLASKSVGNKWLTEYKNRVLLTDEHIEQGISAIALKASDSRSPDDTRLKAYETLARIKGMLDGNKTSVTIVQPILGGQSVPDRVKVDNQPIDQ